MTMIPHPPSSTPPEPWRFDRSVPVGVLLALLGNTLFFIYLGASLQQEVKMRLDRLEAAEHERKPQEARLIRLEEQLRNMIMMLEKIEAHLQERRP